MRPSFPRSTGMRRRLGIGLIMALAISTSPACSAITGFWSGGSFSTDAGVRKPRRFKPKHFPQRHAFAPAGVTT
jgi:hypothetical protein